MQNDFAKGKVSKIILAQAIPLMVAQLVHLLYNVVDRIYIGHLEEIGSLALTGVGLAFPLTTLVAAFTNLFASGGTPLFAIARGKNDDTHAERILGQVVALLVITSIILFLIGYGFRKPILYLFGASDESYYYANEYLKVYLFGTTAAMLSTGLNGFINASGYPKIGMLTIFFGAMMNLILDPIFIYGLHMGVKGAAIATVLSQIISCIWVLRFFSGTHSPYVLKRKNIGFNFTIIKELIPLGIAGFIMQGTNALVQILCNVTLKQFGGDLYVGIMTIVNSIREILSLPSSCVTQGTQPIVSFNYGAKNYDRIRESIRFMSKLTIGLMSLSWALVLLFPKLMMSIFINDIQMIEVGIHALRMYFFGFIFMAVMFAGQSTFTAMKCPKRAIFFSLLRKVIIVVPLILLLPRIGLGAEGVFLAEPISNIVGGLASYSAMYLTVYRKLPQNGEEVIV